MKSFKAFRLDTANHLLWRDGDRVPLTPKGFDVLAYLVENVGQVMSQDKILEALWPETYVNPEVLRKYMTVVPPSPKPFTVAWMVVGPFNFSSPVAMLSA